MRRWWAKWFGNPEPDYVAMGEELAEQVNEALRIEVEEAAERGIIDGIALARQHVEAEVRRYRTGVSAGDDVSRETLRTMAARLQALEAAAEKQAAQGSAARRAELAKLGL